MPPRASTDQFYQQGYLVLPGSYNAAAVTKMQEAFSRLEARAHRLRETAIVDGSLFVIERPRHRPLKIERVVWCGAAEPVLASLGRAPHLLEIVAQLLGTAAVDQLINQAHIKRPGDGVAFSFHQDSYHRRYGTDLFDDVNGRGSFVQVLTAIDAMRPENGGLWLIPGSHHQGHLESTGGRLSESSFDRNRAIPICLNPGDTLLLSPFAIHGSESNLSRSARRLFINGFCCPGANRRQYHGAGTGLRLDAFPGDDETAVRLKPSLVNGSDAPPAHRESSGS